MIASSLYKKSLGLLTVLAGLAANDSMAQTPVTPPSAYGNSSVSYIRTWDAVAPESDANDLMSRPLKDVKQATQYFDGLGRPLQTVVKQGSLATGGSATDLVSPVVYDQYGREVYKYLPFASNTVSTYTNTSDGTFKENPFQQQVNFYNTQLNGQAGEVNIGGNNLNWAYSKTNFETSPLNRATDTYAPGTSWVGSESNVNPAQRRNVQVKYWVNTATDDVKIWGVTNSGSTGTFGTYAVQTSINGGVYAAGKLSKSVTVDEHGKQVIEFKDKEGLVILKKVQLTATADNGTGDDYDGWMCTYYIYDDMANLRCVIQPEGVKTLAANSWSLSYSSGILLTEQCFRYEYDARNRMLMKKVPGAGEVYMVYDSKNRLVMTQDANMRAQSKWLVTKYDSFNRPTETGLWNNNGNTFSQHYTAAYSSSSYPNTSSGYELLTKTHYDDYSSLPSGLSDYLTTWSSHFSSTSNSTWPYPQMPAKSTFTQGLVTWTQTKVLGTVSTFLNTVSYYDDKGRVIQVQSTNVTGGLDVMTTQYSWAGQPLVTVAKQEKGGTNAQTTVAVTKLTYDDLGRLVKTEKKLSNSNVNSGAMSSYKTVAENEYDKLGQLVKKKLAPAYNSNAGLETQNYEYNIRGWMLGMNRDYARDASNNNYFGFDLGYDKTGNNLINSQTYTANQYNGNITGMVWKSRGDEEKRKYDFVYDAANRLLKADFTQYTSGGFNQSAGVNYDMKMGDGSDVTTAYDYNGNIKRMQQWGYKMTGSAQIDDMAYSYLANSNKLMRVTESATGGSSLSGSSALGDFKDGSNTGTDDYSYDVNGNLELDNNKAISSITYNYLNLPSVITVTGKGTITYTYDAAGNKLQKTVAETGQPSKTTTYAGAAVYENDVLQFVGMEEGRIRYVAASAHTCPAQSNRLLFDYMIKDHLGNVRMVLTEQLEDICYIPATVEDASYTTEDDIYDIVNGRRIAKASTGATESSFGDKLYRTHGGLTNEKAGLGVALKVMSGDKVKIVAESFYEFPKGGVGSSTGTIALSELLSALAGSGAVQNAHAGTTASDISGAGANSANMPGFLNGQSEGVDNARAFVMWMLLDEQFKFVTGGADPVNSGGGYKLHTAFFNSPVTVTKNGYLYVYVMNESNVPVYFDNLNITHTPGPILEETHYYPFGLAMKGISGNTLTVGVENKKKFVSQELDSDLELNWYQFKYRNHDPQIGRFIAIDPLADKYVYNTTYAYAENRPIDGIDLEGLEYLRAGEVLIRLNINYSNKQITSTNVRMTKENASDATKTFVFTKANQLRLATDPDPYLLGQIEVRKPSSVKTQNDASATDMQSESIGQSDVNHPAVPKNKAEAAKAAKNPVNSIINTNTGSNKGNVLLAAFELIGTLKSYMNDLEISTDIEKAQNQASTSGVNVVNDLNTALFLKLIPGKYQNNDGLTKLANYLLFGEKPDDFQLSVGVNEQMLKDFQNIQTRLAQNKANPPCTGCLAH